MKGGKRVLKSERKKTKESVLSNERKCYICGSRGYLHKHHIYYGKNRKNSDDYGFWVWLCEPHHTGYCGVHTATGDFLDKRLKEECQREFEAQGHDRIEFMSIIGRNYL